MSDKVPDTSRAGWPTREEIEEEARAVKRMNEALASSMTLPYWLTPKFIRAAQGSYFVFGEELRAEELRALLLQEDKS